MYQLQRKKSIQRLHVNSNENGERKREYEWLHWGKKYETRVGAKRSFFGSQAVDEKWSDDMVNEQFKRYARNVGGVRVVKVD